MFKQACHGHKTKPIRTHYSYDENYMLPPLSSRFLNKQVNQHPFPCPSSTVFLRVNERKNDSLRRLRGRKKRNSPQRQMDWFTIQPLKCILLGKLNKSLWWRINLYSKYDINHTWGSVWMIIKVEDKVRSLFSTERRLSQVVWSIHSRPEMTLKVIYFVYTLRIVVFEDCVCV